MAKAKESIKLKSIALSNGTHEYEVLELSNRVEPRIGEILSEKQVIDLCMEANRPFNNLSVKIGK